MFNKLAVRAIESLESRQLLAVVFDNGLINLAGTNASQTFSVTKSGSNLVVTENGSPQNFALSSVTSIFANLRGGNDTLTIAADVTLPTTLYGGAGKDTITGGGGNDFIDSGIGNDIVDGGAGNDTFSYGSQTQSVTATLNVNYDSINNTPVPDYAGTGGSGGESDLFVNCETLDGSQVDDNLTGYSYGAAATANSPAPHSLTITGNKGNDHIFIDGGFTDGGMRVQPLIVGDGGEGNDTLSNGGGDSNANTLRGGAGDDVFTGDTVIIDAGDGYDTYTVRRWGGYTMPAGLEHLIVEDAENTITGNDEANVIEVHGGNLDFGLFNLLGGNDRIYVDVGLSKPVTIYGGDGDDKIYLGSTDDLVYAGLGDDLVSGGAGNDRLNGDGGKDTLYGGDGDDRIYGNSGTDRLFGDAGVDRLYGGNKDDYLDGGAGADYIKGDEDTDTAKKDKKDRRYESIEIFV